jgi:hypothetical protein
MAGYSREIMSIAAITLAFKIYLDDRREKNKKRPKRKGRK